MADCGASGGARVAASAPSSSSSSASSRALALAAPPSAGVLGVEILGARNLPPAVLGSLLKWTPNYSNPYVVLSLDREQFVSAVKERNLNPSWKELGLLNVPLPSETELLQTLGVPGGGVADGGDGLSKGKNGGKASNAAALAAKKLGAGSAAGAAAAAAMGYRQYHPCAPELYVQVFHHSEDAKAASPAAASASASSSPTASMEPGGGARAAALSPEDKLIGAVVVPLLPCLLSSASSQRGWYELTDEEQQPAGQLQLALNFDVSSSGGLEPQKGDIVRLAGFGGLEYYSKLLPPSARLEVVAIFQDQVLAQTRSQEGWPLGFEFHRNLLHVERRPSILREASTQLADQVTRMRHLRVFTGAQRVWRALPETPRQTIATSAAFTAFSGAQVYSALTRGVNETLRSGIYSGVQTLVVSSKDACGQVKGEFVRVYWTASSAAARPTSGYDDDLVDCGPRKARGHIVRAFTSADRLALDYEDHAEEEMWETYDEDGDFELGAEDEPPEVPEQLICPITGCPMTDPVVAADGHSYEREAILHWFQSSDISPMTGMHMPMKEVFPNFTLRQLSEEVQAASARRQQSKRRRHRRQSATAAHAAAVQDDVGLEEKESTPSESSLD